MVEWKRLNIPVVNPLNVSLILNKTTVNLMETTFNHLGDFKASLVFPIGGFEEGSIFAFVSQKQKGNTNDVFERVYHSLRFSVDINRLIIENFTKTSEDNMYLNVTNSSEGSNRVFAVFGPMIYTYGTFYSIFYSIDKRIEYCLSNKGSLFSVDSVSAYN